MPSVFDHLSARLEQDEQPSGLSPVDLADLPPEQKIIMLTMLRDSASGFEGVAAESLKEKVREKAPNFDETLAQLVGLGWLIPMGEPANMRYRLNLRAKRGSVSGFNLWSILSDRLPSDWKGTIKRDAS